LTPVCQSGVGAFDLGGVSSRSVRNEWAEPLQELRSLREVLERQYELLAAILAAQQRIEEEIKRAGLG
jgi:hypothetical protein